MINECKKACDGNEVAGELLLWMNSVEWACQKEIDG